MLIWPIVAILAPPVQGGLLDIRLSEHARRRAAERSIAPIDIQLVISLGEHIEGVHEGTREACIEIGGKPLTVVYDAAIHAHRDLPNNHVNPKKVSAMKVTYDDQVDALAIQLASADVEATKDLAPGVFVDYDCKGRVLSLEILGASEKYDLD